MFIESLGLASGLILGTKLPISNEVLLGGGLLLSALVPVVPPVVSLITLGVGVGVLVKNIIKERYKSSVEEYTNEYIKEEFGVDVDLSNEEERIFYTGSSNPFSVPSNVEEDIKERAANEARGGFWCFTSTMTFTALPLQLLGLLQGLSSLLMPVSLIGLVSKGYKYLLANKGKSLKALLIGAAIIVGAFSAINISTSGGALVYFLSLITLPSLLGRTKKNTSKGEVQDKFSELKDSFLYGGSTSSTNIIAAALVLGQTILWGSGKDILGTIVNSDTSILFDPIRFSLLILVIVFLLLWGETSLDKFVNKLKITEDSKKSGGLNINKVLGVATTVGSVVFSLVTFNPLIVIGSLVCGMILNSIDSEIVSNISIPLLLIVGVISGF